MAGLAYQVLFLLPLHHGSHQDRHALDVLSELGTRLRVDVLIEVLLPIQHAQNVLGGFG